MLKPSQKIKIYDLAHKAWVTTCMTVTLGATVYVGCQLYQYFTKIKPIKQELEEQFKEELLKEGRMMREAAPMSAN